MMLLTYVSIGILSLAIVLHIFGFNLVWKIKTNSLCSPSQKICLLTLSGTEIIYATSATSKRILIILHESEVIEKLEIWHAGGLNTFYIGVMILLTIDRFLAVFLNINYSVYWTETKTKISLACLLLAALSVSLILIIAFDTFEERQQAMHYIVWPGCNFSFILIALATYIYMYRQISKNKRKQATLTKSVRVSHQSENLRKSKDLKKGFYFPTLLIVTFMMFWIFPDLTFLYYTKVGEKMPKTMKNVMIMLYPLGLACDASLYVIFPWTIRKRKQTALRNTRISPQSNKSLRASNLPQNDTTFSVDNCTRENTKKVGEHLS